MRTSGFWSKRGKTFWVSAGILLVILLGIIDYLTGFEISLSLFYLFPIFMVVWFTNGQMGLVIAFASTISWFIADFSAGLAYSNQSIFLWNTVLRLGVYGVVCWLAASLKIAYKLTQELARTDYVTGAASVRYFYELAQVELARSKRASLPITFVYLDLDNFKSVNDLLGHSIGDRVLRAVAEEVTRQIRPSDRLARLGGDEFGLLMPETDEAAARSVVNRIHASLVDEMLKNGWMVTFSVGVVTYRQVPRSVDEMVRAADSAMYSIKSGRKNGVHHRVFPG
jgi:diguanylate cyclase (GGDEF)-like protein